MAGSAIAGSSAGDRDLARDEQGLRRRVETALPTMTEEDGPGRCARRETESCRESAAFSSVQREWAGARPPCRASVVAGLTEFGSAATLRHNFGRAAVFSPRQYRESFRGAHPPTALHRCWRYRRRELPRRAMINNWVRSPAAEGIGRGSGLCPAARRGAEWRAPPRLAACQASESSRTAASTGR